MIVYCVFMIYNKIFDYKTATLPITLYERHLLGRRQNRLGLTKVTFMAILQALTILPVLSSDIMFLLIPGLSFVVMYLGWCALPFVFDFITFDGIVRKSKYGIIGALRARRQRISYEIAFSLYVLTAIIHFNFFRFVNQNLIVLLVIWLPFLVIIIAELNRAPFDFAELEIFISIMFFNFSLVIRFLIFSLFIYIRRSYPRFRYDIIIIIFLSFNILFYYL
ncbi:unnamed protein product [Haemonchus placei]|uniref:NADH-ubiquinone oxidoreductase chain 1 n=1 Tax=Haemonchus placei TaxID=6290 RepID=A0A0N4WQG0_HAEPC|nr:unnamed protein product [Haemonchus placei]